MSDGVKIEINDEVSSYLSKLNKRMKDPTPALKRIGLLEKSQTQLRFRRGVDPQGKKWKALSPLTKKLRRKGPRSNANPKPLLDTGRLSQSIAFKVNKDSVEIGTNVEYAGFHQYGADLKVFGRASATLPERKFLGINKKTRKNVRNVVKKFIGI